MTREDKLKLVVTAIEHMVETHISLYRLSRAVDIRALPSAEELRQGLRRALVQADTDDDVSELQLADAARGHWRASGHN